MKIHVLSRDMFVDIMSSNNPSITDENIEDKSNVFIISIRCYTGGEHEPHYFKSNHPNVLNLAFDDIMCEIDGYKTFHESQAKELYDFIKNTFK